jgi:hypothetical protein
MPPQNIIEKVMREFHEENLKMEWTGPVDDYTKTLVIGNLNRAESRMREAITTVLLEAKKQIGEGKTTQEAQLNYNGDEVAQQHEAIGYNSAISRSQEVIDALIGKK